MTYVSLRLKVLSMLAVFSIFILAACSVPSSPQLFIAEKTMLVEVGDQRTLNFTTSFPLDDLTWTSSNPEVVSVVGGRITTLKEGTSTVQVTADTGRFFDSVLITVSERATTPEPPVEPEPEVPVVEEPEVPVEPEPEVPVDPEPEVPVVEEPEEEVITPSTIYTITITNETGAVIQTLTLEEGSFITTSSLELPENFKGFFLDEQTCEDEPFDLETPITEDLTLIQASFNDQAPCIQLDYIVLNGRPVAGTTLLVDIFPLGANVTISWYTSVNNRTYSEIPGETESTFTVRPEDSGKFIRVYVVSDSNPPVVRYDTIKLDVFGTVSGPSTPPPLVTTEDFLNAGYIPLASLEDILAINSPNEHTFASGTTFSALAGGGLDQNYIMVDDIDLTSGAGFTDSLIQGTFEGIFNGNGYTLSDLLINSTGNAGLFEQLGTATISNLNIESFHITSNGIHAGLLAGLVQPLSNPEEFYDVQISYISVSSSSIKGTNSNGSVGGLIGSVYDSDLTVINITISSINVSGATDQSSNAGTGGVVGFITNESVVIMTNISMDGNVKGVDLAGGLIGFINASEVSMNKVVNEADVIGEDYVGGIMGLVEDSTVLLLSVTNESDVQGEYAVGGLIGQATATELELTQVSNLAEISGTDFVGGLIGYIFNDVDNTSILISEATNQGNILGLSDVGGLIGFIEYLENGGLFIENSFNVGRVKNNTDTSISENTVGGFIGTVVVSGSSTELNVSIKNSYNAGVISNEAEAISPGSFIGEVFLIATPVFNLSAQSIYYLNHLNHVTVGALNTASNPNSGTIDFNPVLNTLSAMTTLATFTGWDIGATSSDAIWSITEGDTYPWLSFQGEAPSEVDVSSIITLISQGFNLIYTRQDLENINNAPTEKYILMNDIDLDNVSWTPLNQFEGIFEGNNYTISNLVINIPNSGNSGLFESIENATIRNLIISNVSGSKVITSLSRIGVIAGSASNSTLSSVHINNTEINITPNNQIVYVGGMVGETQSTMNITNASFQGKLTLATSTTGTQRVGGLIGWSFGISHIYGSHADVEIEVEFQSAIIGGLIGQLNGGNITKSSVSGSIVNLSTTYSSGGHSGGLVGLLISSNISQSYNLSDVTGADQVGGLVGNFRGDGATISESFNLGTIEGTDLTTATLSRSAPYSGVGGLVGAGGSDNTQVFIKNSYNRGDITGHEYVGGIIGKLRGKLNDNSQIENSYNASNVTGSANVEGIVGDAINNVIVKNSYWDNVLFSFTSSNGTGKDTDDMQLQATYQPDSPPTQNNWDFDDIWTIVDGQGYPTLINNPEPE